MSIFATASEMIQAAVEVIGVQDPAETMDAGVANTGLRTLNLLLDEYSLDRGKIYIRTEDTKTLVIGTGSYTIGQNGVTDINTALPIKIEQAFLRDTTLGLNYPLRVTMTQAEFNARPLDDQQTLPGNLYFQGGIDPGSVSFDYLPDKAYELHLFSHKPFTKLTDINTQLIVPDGYEAAITNALSIRLCPIFERAVPDVVARVAAKMEQMIDNRNLETPPTWEDRSQPATMDWGRGGQGNTNGNIYTL